MPTRTRDLILRDPDDLTFYTRAFEELAEAAVFREEARSVIVRVLEDFARQSAGKSRNCLINPPRSCNSLSRRR
ncbi:hypothetical protein ACFQX6_63890 [Streptosporangium lutulentum]